MIRISANISKKVPITGKEFSSQQFGAALDIEVSDAERPEVIQSRIRNLYLLLSNAVDEQIAGARTPKANAAAQPPAINANQTQPASTLTPPSTGVSDNANGQNNGIASKGNSGGRKTTATQAQCRAVFAICKSLNLDMGQVLANYNVSDPSHLHVKVASELIDTLKSRQTADLASK